MSTVEVGMVVAERYRLERRMSEGGIGSLWRAQDLRAGYTCAVRLGDGAAGSREEILDRFRAEAEAVATIRCTHVLDVYDHGEHDELPFLVTEHVEGEDLGARLRREGRLQPSVAYDLAVQIAKALSRAHAANIVHGDLKPEHVLLVEAEGRSTAKVFNFNLTQRAREVGVASGFQCCLTIQYF